MNNWRNTIRNIKPKSVAPTPLTSEQIRKRNEDVLSNPNIVKLIQELAKN